MLKLCRASKLFNFLFLKKLTAYIWITVNDVLPVVHRNRSWSYLYNDFNNSRNLNMHSLSEQFENFLKCCWINFRIFLGLLFSVTILGKNFCKPTSFSRYSKLDFLSKAFPGMSLNILRIWRQPNWMAISWSRESKFLFRYSLTTWS